MPIQLLNTNNTGTFTLVNRSNNGGFSMLGAEPSVSPTPSVSVTPSVTVSTTPSITLSVTPSITVTPSVSISATPAPTVTPSVTITRTPSISVTPTPTPSSVPSIITSGLVLYVDASNATSYPGTGTTWYDLSPNGYNGTLSGNTTYNSGNGGYITLGSNTGYIDFGLSSAGSNTSAYTWGGWFNIPSFTNIPMARGNDMSGNGWNLATVFLSNAFNASIVTSVPGIAQINASYSSSPSSNTWYNHIAVWNPGVNLKVYINGVLRATTTTSSTNLRSSGIGWNSSNSSTKHNASYGSMVVYNTVLSDADILYNFNVTKTRFGI